MDIKYKIRKWIANKIGAKLLEDVPPTVVKAVVGNFKKGDILTRMTIFPTEFSSGFDIGYELKKPVKRRSNKYCKKG